MGLGALFVSYVLCPMSYVLGCEPCSEIKHDLGEFGRQQARARVTDGFLHVALHVRFDVLCGDGSADPELVVLLQNHQFTAVLPREEPRVMEEDRGSGFALVADIARRSSMLPQVGLALTIELVVAFGREPHGAETERDLAAYVGEELAEQLRNCLDGVMLRSDLTGDGDAAAEPAEGLHVDIGRGIKKQNVFRDEFSLLEARKGRTELRNAELRLMSENGGVGGHSERE